MYEYIKGILTLIQPTYVVVENQGMGYLIYMANPYRLTDFLEKEVTLYLHQHVRDDAIILYGFRLEEEKELFKKLIQVSGIGPKSGLAIMANEDHSGFIRAIEEEDKAFLKKYPGVGVKTAAQLVLDLKGKLADLMPQATANIVGLDLWPSTPQQQSKALFDALEALKALGYSKTEIKRITPKLEAKEEEGKTTDTYLREALSLLMKR